MREDAVPDLDSAETFLLAFDARFAGAASDAMSHCAWEGRSSCDVLAALVPDTAKPLTVLDRACGDGALLQLLARREQRGLHLVMTISRSATIETSGDFTRASTGLGVGFLREMNPTIAARPVGTLGLCWTCITGAAIQVDGGASAGSRSRPWPTHTRKLRIARAVRRHRRCAVRAAGCTDRLGKQRSRGEVLRVPKRPRLKRPQSLSHVPATASRRDVAQPASPR